MKRLLLATACAILCAAIGVKLAGQQPATIGPMAQIHPAPDDHTFPNGQAFVYEAEWRLWTAGTARIAIDQAGDNQRVSGMAEASGVVALLSKKKHTSLGA